MQPPFLLSGLLSVYIRYGIQGTILLLQQYYLNIVYSIMKNVAWQWLDSWPEADCMIGFTTIYILIIPTQAAWAYNRRKRENIIFQNQLFLLKLRFLLKRNWLHKEKNWLRSVYSPLARLSTRKCCICKINICLSCLKVEIIKQHIKVPDYNHGFYSTLLWFSSLFVLPILKRRRGESGKGKL